LNTLQAIKPFLQNVITVLADSLHAEAAIIDKNFNLITCTNNYLIRKGSEVHKPSVECVFKQGGMVVSKPGHMASCKGCRFQHKCPAKLEVLNSINLEESPIGLISLSIFESAATSDSNPNLKIIEKPLEETVKLIEAFVKQEVTKNQLNLYQQILQYTMEQVDEGMILINDQGVILDHNCLAKNIFTKKNLLGEKLPNLMHEQNLLKVSDSKQSNTSKVLLEGMNYLVSTQSIKANNVFAGGLVTFESCDPSSRQSSQLSEKQHDHILQSLIGQSELITALKKKITQVSQTTSTVLIIGETGTGKELVARAIHSLSPRFIKPFIAINCAAIPEALLESELFGYEAGAFTGADKHGKIGFFEVANKGTLFLDEIGDMPPNLQAKLLRVLQDKCVTRVGGRSTIPLDIRIIAATNRNIEKMVDDKLFREDLYYRLNIIPLQVPALRDRKDDIPLLSNHFFNHFTKLFHRPIQKIAPEFMQHLMTYHWPGNIRELENTIEYAINVETENIIQVDSLPEKIKQSEDQPQLPLRMNKITSQGKHLADTIDHFGWSVAGKQKAAEQLGMSIRTLYRKVREYNLTPSDRR
jgi:sigma-54 dependent transcriptional regulator, acetoin dehydrogenase operon transcriptional activator AcoR